MKKQKPRSIRATLSAARNLIRNPKNWIKGLYHDGDRFCTIGALNEVDGPFEKRAEKRLEAVLSTLGWYQSVEGYNDLPGTKHADIMRLFDKAIKLR